MTASFANFRKPSVITSTPDCCAASNTAVEITATACRLGQGRVARKNRASTEGFRYASPMTSSAPVAPAFSPDPARPRAMLAACPAYAETPLRHVALDGATPLLLKDETFRMGLGSFKALGGVYAVAAIVKETAETRLGREISPEMFGDAEVRAIAGALTFVCASAGNHGLSVAAGARIFGAGARIHLAATAPEAFVARLRRQGAEVVRSGAVYDEAVAAAGDDAAATGALLLADGSWPGYTHRPSLVMEGYTVMAEELRAAFDDTGAWPTHVFLQAGVGGLAAAMAVMIRRNWVEQPWIAVVEPAAAPCLKASAAAGACVVVEGPDSAMGRLDCKAPSLLAFDALRDRVDAFLTVTDAEAATATRRLGDAGLRTTPSGAAGVAAALRAALPSDARPLTILSEGEG